MNIIEKLERRVEKYNVGELKDLRETAAKSNDDHSVFVHVAICNVLERKIGEEEFDDYMDSI